MAKFLANRKGYLNLEVASVGVISRGESLEGNERVVIRVGDDD
jgi:hypothetical protein